MLDPNLSGFFSLKDFHEVMKKNGLIFGKKEMGRLYSVLDQNGNQKVTFEEFKTFMLE